MRNLIIIFIFIYWPANNIHAQNSTSYTGKVGNETYLLAVDSIRYGLENPFLSISNLQTPDTAKILQVIKHATHLNIQTPDSVLAMYKNALEQSKLINFSQGIIASMGNIGNVYIKRGFYKESIRWYKLALSYCIGSVYGSRSLSSLYSSIGLSYQAMGEYDTAIIYFYRAVNFAENILSSTLKTDIIYNNLSIVFIKLRQYDKALYYLNKEEYQCIRTKNYRPLCYIYVNKASIYISTKQWDKSLYYARQAIKYEQQYNMSTRNALVNIGYYYLLTGAPAKALPYLLKAYSLHDDAGATDKVVGISALGYAYKDLHNYVLAKKNLLNASEVATSLKLTPDLISIHGALSGLYAKMGNYKQAYQQVVDYADIKDSMETVEKSKNINQLEIKYQTVEKDKALLQKQAEITKQHLILKSKNILLWSISGFIVALICILAISYRNYRNYRKLQAEKIKNLQQEKEMSQLKAVLTGEEQERNRIGQELHDGIGGLLAAAKMNLSAIKERYAGVVEVKDFHEINNILNETSAEVRNMAHNLMPDILLNYTLAEALQSFCEYINKKNQLQIKLHFYGMMTEIPETISLPIYRIVQELIQNIIKHADASLAKIDIYKHEKIINITIEDNGKGFDTNCPNNGMGLKNVYSRVRSLQGDFSIESSIGNGTVIHIALEVKNEHIVASKQIPDFSNIFKDNT